MPAKKLTLICSIAFAQLSSVQTQACSCSSYPIDPTAVIKKTVQNKIARRAPIDDKDINMIKAYPGFYERMNIEGYKGTSCEIKGPQDESLFLCSPRRKADFEVFIPSKNCKVIVRAKYNLNSVSAKIISSDCK